MCWQSAVKIAMKKTERILARMLIFPLLFMATGCAKASRETEVIFFRIGQADAILLFSGDHAALIDAGEKEDGEEILRYLQKREIHSLDLMLITHYDKDHVGGADTVLEGIAVGAVYDASYEKDSKHYRAYTEALKATGTPRYRVTNTMTLTVGDWVLTLRPTALAVELDNDRSLAIVADDTFHRFFFAGDAEEVRLAELLNEGLEKVDVVKMPHHGKYHANFPEFLEALGAGVAVITDSEKNPAQAQTVTLLREMQMKSYQTQNGDIRIISNEDGLLVQQ